MTQASNGTNGTSPRPSRPITADDLHRFQEIVGNALSVSRAELFRSLVDPRRDVEDEAGLPRLEDRVGVELYRQLYQRDAIAARVVEVMPKEAWQITPTVYETEDVEDVTPFEEAWDALSQSLRGQSWYQDESGSPIWEHLIRADILSGIGAFGVLLLGFDDGKPLDQPIDGVVAGVVTNARGQRFVMGDGPPAQDETDAIRDMLTNKAIDVPVAEWSRKTGYTRNVQRREARFLNDPLIVNRVQDRSNTRAIDSSGADRSGLPDSSVRGTDAQYFGSWFGPSQQPATEPAPVGRKLLFLRAFDESLVQVVRWEWNLNNPRLGMPVLYRITLNDPREYHSGVGLPLATVFVHWSRVIHLARVAENAAPSEVLAPPVMRTVLNNLLGLHKLYAGAPEMFWKAAVPTITAETNPALGGDVDVDIGGMQNTFENLFNGLQRYLLGLGMSFKMLAPTVSDPTANIAAQLEAIAIKLGCPLRILKGSERGELASSQDDAAWNDRVRHHQMTYETPRVIVPFIDRLIATGVLPVPKKGNAKDGPTGNRLIRNAQGKVVGVKTDAGYSVEWPDLDSLTDKDKAAIALQKTQALQAYVAGSVESVIPPHDYLTRILGFDDEQATAILDSASEAHDNEETMTIPPMVAGRPAAPAEGSADFEKQQQQQEQAKAQAAALAKGAAAKPPGAAPLGAGAKPPGTPPKPSA